MANLRIIELGGNKYNGDYLRSVSEEVAIAVLKSNFDIPQIRNAWKQANGKTERNYQKKTAAKKSEKGSTATKKPRARKASSKTSNKEADK